MHEQTGQDAQIEQHMRENYDPYRWSPDWDFWFSWLGGFLSGVIFGVLVVAYHLFT